MDNPLLYATALASAVLALYSYSVFRRRSSAIRDISGPPSPSWIFGHIRQLILSAPYGAHEFKWLDVYGSVYALKGCFGQERLMVADPLALQHILNSPKFGRAPILDNTASLLFGEGSVITASGGCILFSRRNRAYVDADVWTEAGSEHRRLRSALNMGFTAAAVRGYEPVFKRVAEKIADQLEGFSTATDICSVLSPATLEAISQAILGHPTQELGEDFVANNIEIVKLTASHSETHILADAIGSYVPTWVWRAAIYLPTTGAAVARKERSFATQVGGRIVQEKIDAAEQGLEMDNDLFSLILNPNPSDNTKTLSVEDIIAQIALILIAGQETTARISLKANALAFGLLELARHREFQDELRAEIYSNLGANATNMAYENMPLLNAFLKETLRLYPAVPQPDRMALEDTAIPLGESITTLKGERISRIPVRKGQLVTLAIASYQRLASRWGVNPHEFNPSRWLDGKTNQGDAVGPYANLLSFLGGPKTCLGWRFA
ncbi:cytochrome P450 [Mycena metata]|uniref:Cytochrome P450 n=1 Tax=Mycena metata TaxID=1033252 RepID=A0AAD7JGD1_9AGAR|nr:cytochrome P450 [Mycena metata]